VTRRIDPTATYEVEVAYAASWRGEGGDDGRVEEVEAMDLEGVGLRWVRDGGGCECAGCFGVGHGVVCNG